MTGKHDWIQSLPAIDYNLSMAGTKMGLISLDSMFYIHLRHIKIRLFSKTKKSCWFEGMGITKPPNRHTFNF